ncbi:deoxyribose-phosphate aldolase [Methyloraptor flagellatus]|uniref:Deoxyribose-phosphate aldolase n=1 Tax=Methyloraptor flagellatus TaxID=3162530 RepID=A0AAU7X6B3_9HYPH
MTDLSSVARRALPLLDLTDLSDGCTDAAIDALCARAETPVGNVAAVCVFPAFVARAKKTLAGTGIAVATVVNFPAGGDDTVAVEAETDKALADGADEIDLVMPYRAFLAGRPGFAETQIVRVKRRLGAAHKLKVILETGRLVEPAAIRAASDLALGAGADFIKTSTGKVDVNATPAAAEIMLTAIRDSGRPAGFKAAGGIRTAADAAVYLDLADRILGPDWASARTFRFGASGLLDDLLAQLGHGAAAKPSAY